MEVSGFGATVSGSCEAATFGNHVSGAAWVLGGDNGDCFQNRLFDQWIDDCRYHCDSLVQNRHLTSVKLDL